MRSDFFEKFKEDDFDLTDERRIGDWTSKQTYIALGNMMTAAAYLQIDSCPIEGFNRDNIEKILREENIVDMDKFNLSVMVAFGYRSENKKVRPKTRQSIDDVVVWK